jgi:glucose-6-phosphate-specific signal transduction histidine kinase
MTDQPTHTRVATTSPFWLYVWPVLFAALSATRAGLYQTRGDNELFFLFAASAVSFVATACIRRFSVPVSRHWMVWSVAVFAAASALQVLRHSPPGGYLTALYGGIAFLTPIALIAMDGAMIKPPGRSTAVV